MGGLSRQQKQRLSAGSSRNWPVVCRTWIPSRRRTSGSARRPWSAWRWSLVRERTDPDHRPGCGPPRPSNAAPWSRTETTYQAYRLAKLRQSNGTIQFMGVFKGGGGGGGGGGLGGKGGDKKTHVKMLPRAARYYNIVVFRTQQRVKNANDTIYCRLTPIILPHGAVLWRHLTGKHNCVLPPPPPPQWKIRNTPLL